MREKSRTQGRDPRDPVSPRVKRHIILSIIRVIGKEKKDDREDEHFKEIMEEHFPELKKPCLQIRKPEEES